MNWVDGGLEIETTITGFWSPMSDQDREAFVCKHNMFGVVGLLNQLGVSGGIPNYHF